MFGIPGTFWAMNLGEPAAPAAAPPQASAVFARAGPGAAEEIARMNGDSQASDVLQRLAAGRRCYLARVGGAVAAYGWVSFEQEDIGEQGLRLRLPPGEAYVWNCVTAPAHRRRGLYAGLLGHIAAEMRAEGLCRLWIGADLQNVPSIKGMARAGFRPVVDLYTIRLLGRPIYWMRRRPGASAALAAAARRVLLGR